MPAGASRHDVVEVLTGNAASAALKDGRDDVPRSLLVRLGALLALGAAVAFLAACSDGGTAETANPFPERQRVLIVHSYDEGFRWTSEQGRGIVEGLGEAGLREGRDYELRTFFMDTRITYTSPDAVSQQASEARRLIEDFEPSVVFVTDDAALREVAVRWVEEHPGSNVAFVFSGVNVDPTAYKPIASLERPGGRITGLLERIPVAEASAAMQRVFPAATRVALLADGSASSAAAIADYTSKYPGGLQTPLRVTGFTQARTFAEWQRLVAEAGRQADVIGVLNYHGIVDDSGQVVPPSTVLDWTLRNASKPVVGLLTDWVRDGMAMGVGNSGLRHGMAAGRIGAGILGGGDPGQVAIVDPKLVETAFNLEAVRRLGWSVPQGEIAAAGLVIR
ncbi:MAG: ABC transporter substrate binding protein [Dehalococcoidia bacterium]